MGDQTVSDTLIVCATLFSIAAVAAYAIHRHYADKDKARLHETKLTVELAAKVEQLLPLDEHIRTSLENYKTALVAALLEQRAIVKGLDLENKKVAGKETGRTLLGRLPNP